MQRPVVFQTKEIAIAKALSPERDIQGRKNHKILGWRGRQGIGYMGHSKEFGFYLKHNSKSLKGFRELNKIIFSFFIFEMIF